MRKYDSLDFVKKICLEKGFIFLENSFLGVRGKYQFKCIAHNEIYTANFNDIINGSNGLRCCGLAKGFRSQKYTLKEISKLSKSKNLSFEDSTYTSNTTYHNFKCLNHGVIFKQNWANINVKNTMPPCCKIEKKNKRLNYYLKVCENKNVEFLDTNIFKNTTTKYRFKCLIHNEIFINDFANIEHNDIGLRCCGTERLKTYKHLSGKDHPHWNPSLTEKQRLQHRSTSNWRKKIKIKFNNTCFICSKTNLSGRDCIAHHLESYRSSPDLALDLSNGVCLCGKCHINFHKEYGFGNNTKKQFNQFLKSNKLTNIS